MQNLTLGIHLPAEMEGKVNWLGGYGKTLKAELFGFRIIHPFPSLIIYDPVILPTATLDKVHFAFYLVDDQVRPMRPVCNIGRDWLKGTRLAVLRGTPTEVFQKFHELNRSWDQLVAAAGTGNWIIMEHGVEEYQASSITPIMHSPEYTAVAMNT